MRTVVAISIIVSLTVFAACSNRRQNDGKQIQLGEFRVANDKWIQRVSGHIIPYDKPVHLIVFIFFGIPAGVLLARNKSRAFLLYTIVLALGGLLWEIKDAYVYWETAPYISLGPLNINVGGDGFSWKDYVANAAGYVIGLLLPITLYSINTKR